MVFRLSARRSTFRRPPLSPRQAYSISYMALPLETPVEEEALPHYRKEEYYPVNIGDVYESRYEIAGKLGYGAYSTSWLCRDLRCVPKNPCITSV